MQIKLFKITISKSSKFKTPQFHEQLIRVASTRKDLKDMMHNIESALVHGYITPRKAASTLVDKVLLSQNDMDDETK